MTEKVKVKPYADIKNPFIVNEKGAFAEYILRDPEAMPELALGARALVHDIRNNTNIWLAATVVDLRAISPFQPERQNLLYIEDEGEDPTKVLTDGQIKGPHSHQPMLIRVRFERELTLSENKFWSSAVQRPPSASSYLVFPDLLPHDPIKEPSLSDLLEIKSDGMDFGVVGFGNTPYEQAEKFLYYKWDVKNLDNRHMFIVGESGSGKTVLLKNLALQIRKHEKDMRIIMTDVQGDLSQLLVPDVLPLTPSKGWQTKVTKDTMENSLKTLGPFQLIVPVSNESAIPDDVLALKKLAIKRGAIVREIGLRLQDVQNPSDVEYLYRTVSEQAAMLLDDQAEELQTNSKPVTIENLRAAISRLMANSTSGTIQGSDGTPYLKTTFSSALRALKSLSNYFDHHQPSMTLGKNPLDYLDHPGTTIIYLEHLNYEERLMWEMQLVKWLYDHKRESWNAFVFVDEAHQIVPASSPGGVTAKGTFDRLRNNFEKLSREGRKYGIHLVLSTQSPKDLHEIVPQQCPTRIVMKIDPKNGEASFLSKDLAMIANRFSQGQFWLLSPFNGTPDWVRIHSWMPNLPHWSMTPYGIALKAKAKE